MKQVKKQFKDMKPIQVTWNGKPLRKIYPHATAWQVFKFKLKRFLRKCLIALFILGMLWIGVQIVHNAYPNVVYKAVEKVVVLDNLKGKIDQLQGELVNDMWNNERAGKTEEDVLITWDPNPNHKTVQVASIGTCQYKLDTLQADWLDHRGEKLTRKQALMIALDDQKCKSIMTEVITEESRGWEQWYNSGIKYNAKSRLSMIAELKK